MFELVLPRRCAGCAAAGQVLCEKCQHALAALPYRVSTGVDTLARDTDVVVRALPPAAAASSAELARDYEQALAAALKKLRAKGK